VIFARQFLALTMSLCASLAFGAEVDRSGGPFVPTPPAESRTIPARQTCF